MRRRSYKRGIVSQSINRGKLIESKHRFQSNIPIHIKLGDIWIHVPICIIIVKKIQGTWVSVQPGMSGLLSLLQTPASVQGSSVFWCFGTFFHPHVQPPCLRYSTMDIKNIQVSHCARVFYLRGLGRDLPNDVHLVSFLCFLFWKDLTSSDGGWWRVIFWQDS